MSTASSARSPRFSDRERSQLEAEVAALENRIDEAVLRLYGVAGLSS